jgi:hypothetical protein
MADLNLNWRSAAGRQRRWWKCNGTVAIFKPAKRKNQTKPKWLSVINKENKNKNKTKIK